MPAQCILCLSICQCSIKMAEQTECFFSDTEASVNYLTIRYKEIQVSLIIISQSNSEETIHNTKANSHQEHKDTTAQYKNRKLKPGLAASYDLQPKNGARLYLQHTQGGWMTGIEQDNDSIT